MIPLKPVMSSSERSSRRWLEPTDSWPDRRHVHGIPRNELVPNSFRGYMLRHVEQPEIVHTTRILEANDPGRMHNGEFLARKEGTPRC